MDVRKLEAFIKVYELMSFSRAGEELYLSQPTISAHISALESELGMPLFDRLGRSILPTRAAEILYRHAQDVFSSLAAATAEIQLLQERVVGDLFVGGSTIPATYVLPPLVKRFSARYPEVHFMLRLGDSESIIRRIAGGEDMVGMVGAMEEHPDLTFEPLIRDDLVIIAAPGEPYVGDGLLSPGDLADLPWVEREQGSGTLRAFVQALASLGLEPPTPSMRVQSTESAIQCARAGIGATVTSRLAAGEALARGVVTELKVQGLAMRRDFYLVYHAKRHLFPVARYFVEFLRQECRAQDTFPS
ncbi:selenium metabolism-associated LysR family transcriptional regulator [Desulfocurvus sp. DL9XJH121]